MATLFARLTSGPALGGAGLARVAPHAPGAAAASARVPAQHTPAKRLPKRLPASAPTFSAITEHVHRHRRRGDSRGSTAAEHRSGGGLAVATALDCPRARRRCQAAAAAAAPAERPAALPKHSRSPIAKARRQVLKRQKAKARKPFSSTMDAAPRRPLRRDRLARAEAVAFRRGVAAERAIAKVRRGAKRVAKMASKAQVRASKRAARHRRAARM